MSCVFLSDPVMAQIVPRCQGRPLFPLSLALFKNTDFFMLATCKLLLHIQESGPWWPWVRGGGWPPLSLSRAGRLARPVALRPRCAQCFLFALKEEITVVSLGSFSHRSVYWLRLFLALSSFFLFRDQCKLSTVLRIKPSEYK